MRLKVSIKMLKISSLLKSRHVLSHWLKLISLRIFIVSWNKNNVITNLFNLFALNIHKHTLKNQTVFHRLRVKPVNQVFNGSFYIFFWSGFTW